MLVIPYSAAVAKEQLQLVITRFLRQFSAQSGGTNPNSDKAKSLTQTNQWVNSTHAISVFVHINPRVQALGEYW